MFILNSIYNSLVLAYTQDSNQLFLTSIHQSVMNDARKELARMRGAPSDGDQAPSVPPFYDPLLVITHALSALSIALPPLEKFAITEQLIVAALNTSNRSLAQSHLQIILKAFPDSARAQTLKAMLAESADVKLAAKLYSRIIAKSPASSAAKRLAFLKPIHERIQTLLDYSDTFSMDPEPLVALMNLYIDQNHFSYAAFCIEELMVMDPMNLVYMLRYADLMAAMDEWDMGLKYYCRVLETCSNTRAWYGVFTLTSLMIKKDEQHDGLKENESGGIREKKKEHKMNGKKGKDKIPSNVKESLGRDTLQKLNQVAKEQITLLYSGKTTSAIKTTVDSWLRSKSQ